MSKLEIVWSSAMDEYEKLTLEILLDRYPVVRVNGERGPDKLEAELGGPEPDGRMARKIPLDDLIEALIDIRKTMASGK
ncbi:hypothetical protein KZJ38_08970 [Paraburkholderia edwinii]|jgi:hypothetical protein|uniref:Uncharacterized protein n=1 Tax=Paraburkholderia edwinii TaxID=2861782 RepID=A0ABX8UNF4_9BURK|nr:hypothetical protein [Paraburkholderia edwinii]QYD70399.1 hypothetical protein KZJ38_08970 [Paraburkholderia edwinii]